MTILVTRVTMVTSSPEAAMFTFSTLVAWLLTLASILWLPLLHWLPCLTTFPCSLAYAIVSELFRWADTS